MPNKNFKKNVNIYSKRVDKWEAKIKKTKRNERGWLLFIFNFIKA